MKPILSIDELISHMKSKGITFDIVSEEDAKNFLQYNNYYMKLAAYRKNYEKADSGTNKGKYINLDFGYLQELSTIDMHLRYLIIQMCLDIEHAIKVCLLRDITNNPKEDGYNIVRKFLANDRKFRILNNIKRHQSGTYCKDLIDKYYPYFPVWVFVELVSFGDLLYFYSFYQEQYGIKNLDSKILNVVRDIRNASAHSNCLINNLFEKNDCTKQPNSKITNFVKNMDGISKAMRSKYLSTRFSYSFVTLLYVYNMLVADVAKNKRFSQLKNFMEDRVIKNKDYFAHNQKIIGIYKFHEKILDNITT